MQIFNGCRTLPPGADPLTATWQSHDFGTLHNAALNLQAPRLAGSIPGPALGAADPVGRGAAGGNPDGIPPFPPAFWTDWRGASDPALRSTGCCTDA